METWKLLLLTILAAVVLGCVIGVWVGKYMVRRAQPDYRPLLTVKQKVICSCLLVVGALFILLGAFANFGPGDGGDEVNGLMEGEMGVGEFPFPDIGMDEYAGEEIPEPESDDGAFPEDADEEDAVGDDIDTGEIAGEEDNDPDNSQATDL